MRLALLTLTLLAFASVTHAAPPKCVLFPLTTVGTESAVASVDSASANWTVSLSQLGCVDTHTSANATFYGPRLDSTGHRGTTGEPIAAATPALTLTTWQHGFSVVGGVSVNPVAVPSPNALACVGGSANGNACTLAAQCPGGRCGPCAAFVAFCGESGAIESP